MSREIKFRAKRLNSDDWVYGNLFKNEICTRIIKETATIDEEGFLDDYSVVDPKTVGQFIGFADTNEEEIYEGDILQYDSENGIVTSKVVFNKSDKEDMTLTCFEMELINVEDYENDEAVEFTVIGNIHDNPELLNVS
ncbi:YopX family protein [Chryseobacterium taichungense]|uniref:YopX family protein n=1 Tax=Chryseobacterium taichungense TaxID=295069 RepID=UPI0028A72AAF|nr:YopX family protein [Chryseobacterium taichungense]